MQKFIRLTILLTILGPVTIMGQSFNNNPYSRYGIGELNNSGFAYNRSLGGSGIALRQTNNINPLNPASYTSQDTLSFLFQTGVSAQRSHIITDIDEDDANTMKVEYLAMGFPITRWFKFSLGLIPFNRVSYYYMEYQQTGEDIAIENHGVGGFNDFYLGGSIQPFKFLSLGFNASYLFGKISSYQMVDIPNYTVAGTRIREEYNASDFRYTAGLQLHPVFTDKGDHKHKFVLGATYDIPVEINLNYNSLAARNFPSQVSNPIMDTFRIVVDSAIQMKLPARYGIGISYTYNEKLTLTLDYSKQKFSEGLGIHTAANLRDYTTFRFGADYIPVPLSSRERADYFERVHYCIGGHFTNTYLNINDTPINDYGFSLGFSLPLRNQQKLFTYSTVNLTYEYGVLGTKDNGLIRNNYHLVTLGIILHDYWFLKPKYD